MHLVRQDEVAPRPTRRVGGLAGWLMELGHAVWLGARMRREQKKQMRVIETLSIGGSKQLVLVSCAGEQFLVGTGSDSVQTMVRVRAESAVDETMPARGMGERL